jgi:Zn-dependent protease with chaperone function
MKRIFVLAILSIACLVGYAQEFDLNLNIKMLRSNGDLKKGETYTLKKFIHKTTSTGYSVKAPVNSSVIETLDAEEFYVEDANGKRADINTKIDDCFQFTYNNIQDLWDSRIITNVLYNLKKKGFQYELRSEMEDDALDYIQHIKNMNLELNDPFLEAYLYSLVAKIAPKILIDGRPCSINLLIQQTPNINACAFPNGTIVLNTGLLASIHSEDELVAILAHEIAHFVLDHCVINVNKAIARQKRAEFWAAVATGITAVAEGVAAANNSYYVPGAATMGMATVACGIAEQVVDRLGMMYNHDQENEADQMALQVLKLLGYDVNAMSTALSQFAKYYVTERMNVMYFASYSHPALMERIRNCGTPQTLPDKEFEKIVSFAVTNVAYFKFDDRRFLQCIPYLKQNIENNVATAEDYILMANCLLNTQDTELSNQKVIDCLQAAKQLDDDINIYKVEILAKLRQHKKGDAEELLKKYIQKLDLTSASMDNIRNGSYWEQTRRFVSDEQYWAHQMLIKLSGMK